MFTKQIRKDHFALVLSVLTLLLFHFPFFKFVFNNLNYKNTSATVLTISLIVLMILANFFFYYVTLSLSILFGKIILICTFLINTIAIYFFNTYNVIMDESMIANVLNTNLQESSSFFSFKLILYFILFTLVPCFYIFKFKILKNSTRTTVITLSTSLLTMLVLVFINSSNWLWIDKHSKQLGALTMPWSYCVNTSLHFIHKAQKNKKEILLPNAVIKDSQKSIVVLVIGESARRENFSLYGYSKNTNPLLSNIDNIHPFKANSVATYTTAGVKAILEHKDSNNLYEILPNYLYRHNVEVIWKTTNWGEPPVHTKNYQNKEFLQNNAKDGNAHYDEVLLTNLKEDILKSQSNKILVVLHTSTSHGPLYNKKYPKEFETFQPVCTSVELANCTQNELINAYDNTILYTDYILSKVIDELKELKQYKSTMIFVSDHGESLGEKNMYMHGLPMSIAPKQQFEIPFIVWLSDNSKALKPNEKLSQHHVFHSVLNFLNIDSPIYDEQMNIFNPIGLN